MTRWGKQQGGWRKVENVSFAREVEEVPLHAGSSSSKSPAVAALPQPRGTDDADEENNGDVSSVNFSEVDDNRATNHAGQPDAENGAFTAVAVGRMERETSPVYRTEFTEERLAFWKTQIRYG